MLSVRTLARLSAFALLALSSAGAFAQTVLTALTFAVSKGTDRGIEDEVASQAFQTPCVDLETR